MHVDFFLKLTMQESCLDIKLLKLQVKECNHSKQHANRALFYNRKEYLIQVNTLSLTKVRAFLLYLLGLRASASAFAQRVFPPEVN